MSLNVLLTEIASRWVSAKNEKFKNHPIANLLRKDLIDNIKEILGSQSNNYSIKSSPGAGNWADVPWLSILNPSITTSTQSGIYPVYLFRADGSGVYLSLGFGTTELINEYGAKKAKEKALELRESIIGNDQRLNKWNGDIDLRSSTTLGKSYEWASAGAKFYPVESIPSDDVLLSDLEELLQIYSKVKTNTKQPKSEMSAQANEVYKPFILLAGISGTGKTRFVREQAKALGSINETYQLVAVRPDWHEPSDLLGYISRLGGSAEYVTTDVIKFIAKAWRAILDSGLELSVTNLNGQGDRLVVVGEKAQLDNILPYWLCLDEMNLAPVEQYFADYLSILETREWHWQGDDFQYCCDAILNSTTIEQFSDKDKVRNELGFADPKYDLSWDLFVKHGFSIPFNLIVAGTVNMDETTHGFSRKVIDRALSFDFGEFFPNDFDHFFAPVTKPVTLSYPTWSDARQHMVELPAVDSDGKKSIEFLKSINSVLKSTPFELAFRALNELLLAVISSQPENKIDLQAVWDDFLMCKVLPRIEGDYDKLATIDGGDNYSAIDDGSDTLLDQLYKLLAVEFSDIWNGSATRPDLYREKIVDSDKIVNIDCRSKAKLEWMQQRLSRSSFTSFWP